MGHHRDIECRLSWKTSTDTEHRSSGLTDVSLKDLTLSARRARIFGFNLASVEMGGHRIQASKERKAILKKKIRKALKYIRSIGPFQPC